MALAGPMTVVLVLVLRSSSARVVLAAPVVQDLAVRVQAARVVAVPVVLVVPVAPVVRGVAPVPVGVVAVLVAVPLVRLAAVAARASPASRSGRSVKSLKCGRHQASAVCKFRVAMVRPSSGFARAPQSVISRRRLK